MVFDFRAALPTDANAIAALKKAVWPDEDSDPFIITQAILDHHHSGVVVCQNSDLIGFVDGFLSISPAGEPRWEVDLLAIHPDYRGARLAEQLVRANHQAGREKGAQFSRALIRINNIASQRTFQRCGFHFDGALQRLFVRAAENNVSQSLPKLPDELIPVKTYNYQGVWLEGNINSELVAAAQTVCASRGLHIMGAVISEDQPEMIQVVDQAKFHFVAQYQWWVNWL